jgi:putative acetyltransferase
MAQASMTSPPTSVVLRRLTLAEMDAAALVHRAAFDERLPWLAGRHTPEEDREFFRRRVFRICEVWGALSGSDLAGIVAFRSGWVDALYVLPQAQGMGIGSRLLGVAQTAFADLQLWTFQRNALARRFYEARGFRLLKETDGRDNEEKEPDCLYSWTGRDSEMLDSRDA